MFGGKIWLNFKLVDYKTHLACAFILRLVLIQYGRYHDESYTVPYTDVDYKVFTDAARHVLNYTSPYNRHTYRYTPFIAILLTPNVLFHECFGKLLFSFVDIIVALLIRVIVKHTYKEFEDYKQRHNQNVIRNENLLKLTHPVEGKRRQRKRHKNVEIKKSEVEITADLAMLLWIYNPMTVAIATRGNCDSIAGMLVLATLFFLQCKQSPFYAGLLHGIAIHVRLYPLMYSLTFFMYLSKFAFYSADNRKHRNKKEPKISEGDEKTSKSLSLETKAQKRNKFVKKNKKEEKNVLLKREIKKTELQTYHDNKKERRTIFKKEYLLYLIPNFEQIKLISGCVISLTFLTSFFYLLYGYEFLYESYIYHLVRKDTRHNFSLYFYLQYLTAGVKNVGLWQKLLTLLPQFILLGVFSFRYGLNRLCLNFGVLSQTIVMVSYNAVLTSQYFVWIAAVLPLCLWQIQLSKKMILVLIVIWFTAQAAWLLPAYLLEFHGHNTFMYIWVQSVSFFCANMAILGRFVKNFMPLRVDCDV